MTLEDVWPLAVVKLHGLGNSYIYMDAREMAMDEDLWPDLARLLSDPRVGIGADGLIAICRGRATPFRMRIWNRDGSEAEMCGNGIRGFAKYLFDRGLAGPELEVETGAGRIRTVVRDRHEGQARTVTVDMGPPRFRRRDLPMSGPPDETAEAVELPLEAGPLSVTAVSMGNPHVVHFTDHLWTAEDTARIGQAVERHPAFPERTNFHVAVVESPERVRVRHWERGAGLTEACGTGAAAVVAAGVVTGRLGRRVDVLVPGGLLHLEWGTDGHLWMTGPSVQVFEGIFQPR
jgi:diaminopimelate epimerase